jgi:hypothetical protein
MNLARTSQTSSSVPNGDTTPWYSPRLVPPILLGTTEHLVPPPARVMGTPTTAMAREASHRPADDWEADILTLPDLSWNGEVAAWPAG